MNDIPNTELLKLFYKNVKDDDDERLYAMALRGTLYPNYEEFQRFLSEYRKKNKLFIKTLKRYHLLPTSTKIIETTLNREYALSEFLDTPSTVFESTYGKISLSYEMIEKMGVTKDMFYMSNGMYDDTIKLIPKLIDRASFAVGISENSKYPRFEEDCKKVEKLKKEYREKVKIYKAKDENISLFLIAHKGENL